MRRHCEVGDLEDHLKRETERYARFKDKVKFYCLDASELQRMDENPFEYVLASQFIHWPRKKDIEITGVNYDYEQKVLAQVRGSLVPKGVFAFNTSAADYRFQDENRNKVHLLNHPFYIAFQDAMSHLLGLTSAGRNYTFDHNEMERIMRKAGFLIKDFDLNVLTLEASKLVEICLVGGHMQIFQKLGIEASPDEREIILAEALRLALRKTSPSVAPVIETFVHYSAVKQ